VLLSIKSNIYPSIILSTGLLFDKSGDIFDTGQRMVFVMAMKYDDK